ncbi:hypothetical protein CSB45_01425 [candidate division KSB3 bacterium]|uniref:DUF3352 domain-containing protein n=1 Tax=candidate division KSB3 bacterium TaxID=2044937 RepID=A0A2G6EAJ7_9BACT|nr:MAG: hypothetical protein CSB45_01425 [candidate division KSB3 bacterium]PIE30743.1 MAG: hypothetical protein CSA57_01925 [candidate division KSB3 bacterium]
MLQLKIHKSVVFLSLLLSLIYFSLSANAQEDVVQIASTGLPVTAAQEDTLPQGAVVHLRVNNLELLLENIDTLLTSFVPEQAAPPEFQAFLQSEHPFLAFLTTQMFGREMPANSLSTMFGISLHAPLSFSFYPMDPRQGFVLSVPIADFQGFTEMLHNILQPDTLSLESAEGMNYYSIQPGISYMPEEIYLLTSDTQAFFCASLQTAQMLANGGVEKLNSESLYHKGIEKYAGHDLLVLLSPAFIKAQIPLIQDSLSGALEPLFQQLRTAIRQSTEEYRSVNIRLRWQFGVENLDQLLDFIEAYTTAFYQTGLEWVARRLQELDGLALAIDLDRSIQQLSTTLYTQDVKPEHFAVPLPLPEIKNALAALPGSKFAVNITGQTQPYSPSRFLQDFLFAAEQELKKRKLPLQTFSALKQVIAEQQHITPLSSKTPWTMSTILTSTEALPWEDSDSLTDLLVQMMDIPLSLPLLMGTKMMPEMEITQVKSHFEDMAKTKNANALTLQDFYARLALTQPFFEGSSTFYSSDYDEGITALVFENNYRTRRGYFGYQQHEWINRRIILSENKNGYTYLYDFLPDEEIQNALIHADPEAISPALLELFDLVPKDANSVNMLRVLPAVSNGIYALTIFEQIAFQELDRFLKHAEEILSDLEGDAVEEALLRAGIAIPVLAMQLKRDDDNGSLYCVLPGGLYYPRSSVASVVQELFNDFNEGLDRVGGSLAFSTVRAGELEYTALQRSDGVALLMKTLGNKVFEKYFSTPDGINRLVSQLTHPKDRAIGTDTLLFTNALWEDIRKLLEDSGDEDLRELADILVPLEDTEGATE